MFPALIKKTDLVSLSIKFVLSLPHHTQNFFKKATVHYPQSRHSQIRIPYFLFCA